MAWQDLLDVLVERGTGGRMPGDLRDALVRQATPENLGNLAKGVGAGLAGMPVDMLTMVARPFGYDIPLGEVVGSSDWLGHLMDADTESGAFIGGTVMSPDPMAKVGLAAGLLPALFRKQAGSKGSELADQIDNVARQRKAIKDYEKDVDFIQATPSTTASTRNWASA